jgi:hypothetical protein
MNVYTWLTDMSLSRKDRNDGIDRTLRIMLVQLGDHYTDSQEGVFYPADARSLTFPIRRGTIFWVAALSRRTKDFEVAFHTGLLNLVGISHTKDSASSAMTVILQISFDESHGPSKHA